jgi:hypothetical protein
MQKVQGLVVQFVFGGGVDHQGSKYVTVHLEILSAHVEQNDVMLEVVFVAAAGGFQIVLLAGLNNRVVSKVIKIR